jgi:hypothetical protein
MSARDHLQVVKDAGYHEIRCWRRLKVATTRFQVMTLF